MAILNKLDKAIYQLKLGKVARLLDKGLTAPEIAKKMELPESSVRSLISHVHYARSEEKETKKGNKKA